MTLFARSFKDIQVLQVIWDVYFFEGLAGVFKAVIAVLRVGSELEPELWEDLGSILMTTKNLGILIVQHLGSATPTKLQQCMKEATIPSYLADELPLIEQEYILNI